MVDDGRTEAGAVVVATHDVKEKSHVVKRLHHSPVGDLSLCFETFQLAGDTDQALITYHAEPE